MDFIEHAREMNKIARQALRVETEDASFLSAKISIGLSLQAGELAGKAILRSLGFTTTEIRYKHKNHKLLKLLKSVAKSLKNHPREELANYSGYLLRTPTIDGVAYRTTIAAYFEEHFAHGPSAYPRSYLYPDVEAFTGPSPIHAVYYMVEEIIEVAQKISDLCGSN